MSPLVRDKDKEQRSAARSQEASSPDGGPADGGQLERALDALGSILRSWGEHPIELPDESTKEFQEQCEAWARHVLIATEAPSGVALSGGARDWMGLERAFRQRRQLEHTHVVNNQSELRQALWVCVSALGKATVADSRSDTRVTERLETLRAVAQDSDVTTLRKEVTATVNLLDSHIEARRARQQNQVEELSEKLRDMTAALVREKEAGQLDSLTKVYCRAAMDQYLSDVCQMAQVIRPTAILFLMDVDHFKWVNDEFGHSVGDDVLRRVSAAMRREFRRRGDFVARYGGDEFVAVIEEATLENAQAVGERVLTAVREIEASAKGESVRVGLSMGVAALKQGQSPREWLDRADSALYESKNAGRDRLSVVKD